MKIRTGDRFGYWTAKHDSKGPLRLSYVLCVCKCGTEKMVRSDHLVYSKTQSCGCYRDVHASQENRKHGMYGTRVYNIWSSMKQRCLNKKSSNYHNYGGRGIALCDRWMNFETFLSDMGNPEEGMTLERVDVNLGYCPENCTWATYKQQSANKRDSVIWVVFGHQYETTKDAAVANGVSQQTISNWCGGSHPVAGCYRIKKYDGGLGG